MLGLKLNRISKSTLWFRYCQTVLVFLVIARAYYTCIYVNVVCSFSLLNYQHHHTCGHYQNPNYNNNIPRKFGWLMAIFTLNSEKLYHWYRKTWSWTRFGHISSIAKKNTTKRRTTTLVTLTLLLTLSLYSLKRRRLGIGIPLINPRMSSDRLIPRYVMRCVFNG